MNNSPSTQNQRHYERMRETLATIQSDKDMGSLGSLIATLDFLFESLEGVNADWKDKFRKHWGILEEVNAFVLDEGRTGFSDDERKLLNHAVEDLKFLVKEAIHPAS